MPTALATVADGIDADSMDEMKALLDSNVDPNDDASLLLTSTLINGSIDLLLQLNITETKSNSTPGDGDDGQSFAHQRFIHTIAFQIVICLAYTLVFLVGMMGNILVCYIVYSRKHMQNVTNYFITNLALADILLCILAVPFTPLYTFLGKWVFGSVLCRLVASAQGVSVYISSLTLTSIAIDRFIVILYPFRPRMQVTTCVLMIVLIWIFSILAMAPYSVFIRITPGEEGEYYCSEEWPSEFIRRMFGIFTVKLQFIVPFIIVAICYMKISMALGTRVRNMSKSRTSRKDEMERERKRKTNRMLIAMVAIFGISWLPMNLVNVISDMYKPAEYWPYFQMTFSLSHMLAMSSTCYNPILYAWLNETFRKEFKEVMPCWRSVEDDNGRVSNRLINMRPSLYSKANGADGRRTSNGAKTAVQPEVSNVDALEDIEGNVDVKKALNRKRMTEISVVPSHHIATSSTMVTSASASVDLESNSPVMRRNVTASSMSSGSKLLAPPGAMSASLNCKTMEITFAGVDNDEKPSNNNKTNEFAQNGSASGADPEESTDKDTLNVKFKGTSCRRDYEQEGVNRRETRRLLTSDL